MSQGEVETAGTNASEPVAIGSLGRAMAGMQARAQTITVVVTTITAIVVVTAFVPALAGPLADNVATPIALLILGVVCWTIFVLAVAAISIVPPFLLPGRDRAVFAAHAWITAREVRRVVGRPARSIGLPSDARSAATWLARNLASDGNRIARVEALLLAGRFDDARLEAELLPDGSPLEAYRKVEARALIADQSGAPVDEETLRAGVASVPVGIDQTEAAGSFAVFRARRALPHGDWRAPLLEVRPSIPGSDARLLVADFGLPVFEIFVRKAVVPFTVLLAIIVLSMMVLSALPR